MVEVLSAESSESIEGFIVDSGASNHMVSDCRYLTDVTVVEDIVVRVASGTLMPVTHKGVLNGNGCMLHVLVVPNLVRNRISVSALNAGGYHIKFIANECVVERQGVDVLRAGISNGVYVINNVEVISSVSLEHERFGHIGKKKMKLLGLNNFSGNCKGCLLGEHRKRPFSHKETIIKTKNVLERVHMDLVDPMEVCSLGGANYIFTIIDDFSRFSFVYFLSKKSDVFQYFQFFVAEAHNLSKNKIQFIRTDGGGEFCSNSMKQFLQKNGISHQLTMPYSHEQNGIIERLNRSLLVSARSLMNGRNVSKKFWAEAVKCSNFLRNIVPCHSTKKIPYEVFKKKSFFSLFKVESMGLSCLCKDSKRKATKVRCTEPFVSVYWI